MSSSWKQYGGLTQMESSRSINVNTISTDNIILRKAYGGNFDICGSLIVNTNVYIDKDLYENGNSYMNNITANSIILNNRSDFYGPVFFHGDFNSKNNILTQESISSDLSITVGTQLYFNNGVNGSTSADYNYMFGNISGIGLNRIDPVATLDISSSNVYALNVVGHQPVNTNILAQNVGGNGIILSADVSNSLLGFYVNASINLANAPDAYIKSNRNGTMQMETASDVFLQGNLIVSGQNHTNTLHRYNESAVIYDSNTPASSSYFGNVYLDPNSSSACALSLVSNITNVGKRPSTFMYMTSQNKYGAAIGGGQYPNTNRVMSVRGLVDASAVNLFTPFETVVSSVNLDKYLATVGVNTYSPRTESCILDVNGPVHIDNGDINSVISMGFQVKYLNQAIKPSASNFVMAVGTSIDISGSFQVTINGVNFNAYRHPIYFSSDFGKTWKTVTIYPSNNIDPITLEPLPNAVLKGDFLNQVATYDATYAFITGNNNTLIYTYNGGYDWQDIIVLGTGTGPLDFTGLNVAAVQNNITQIIDTITIYFTAGNKFAKFDVSLNQLYDRPIGNTLSVTTTMYTAPMTLIQSITVSSQSCESAYNNIYLAGDKIVVYSKTNLSSPTFIYTNSNGIHNCLYIHAYDDNYTIAVGPQTIITTKNGGSSWTVSFFAGSILNDVCIYDQDNAIAVGDSGIILISNDGGITWSQTISPSSPYYNLFNSSGKANLLLNSEANLRDIISVDPNTFLISNSSVDYVQTSQNGGVYGQSNVYSCFFPNYLNYRNNNVLDICGNMNLYGDMTIHSRDGYNFIDTDLSCTSFGFINSSVLDLNMATNADTITIGNSNTEVSIPGTITTKTLNYINVNTLEIVCDRYTSISNSMHISNSGTVRIASNSIVIGENLSQNNTIQIGNAIGSNATISVGGPTDAISINAPLVSSKQITVNGNVVVSGTSSQFSGINNTGTITSTNLAVSNDATISRNLQVIGNINANQNITVSGNTFVQGPLVVQTITGVVQITAGLLNTGIGNTVLLGCSGTNNTAIGTNIFSPSSSYGIANYGYNGGVVSGTFNIGIGDNVMTQNAMTGNCNTGIGQRSLFANESGSNNNAIGNRSLTSITTGNYNVGVGDYSLGSSQTGNYNTAIGGYYTLQSMVDGSYNTAVGTESMRNVLGGDYNTAVGASSGQNDDNYVTSNCTFLGANAIANTGGGFGSTITNSTAIGYGATVTMDHQMVLGTASETVYIPSTSVGIGKIAGGGYALDINGTARSTGGFVQTSDYRIKDDVSEFPTGFSVDDLRPMYYRNTLTDEYEMGFLAHEVQSVFPFLVQGEKDGEDYQSMKYSGLIALLVKEIQELKRQLREL